jgi:hypothetical protein
VPTRARRESKDVKEVVCDLSAEELREILRSAVDRHPDVERHVLLAAARSEGDFGELRREVDRGLRTRRFLDYHESSAWARAAQPVLEELHLAAQTSPSAELLALIERSVGHVVKVIMHADDLWSMSETVPVPGPELASPPVAVKLHLASNATEALALPASTSG